MDISRCMAIPVNKIKKRCDMLTYYMTYDIVDCTLYPVVYFFYASLPACCVCLLWYTCSSTHVACRHVQ